MPRYEFSEGSSNKFWEITLHKKTFTTTYGKTGTAGQSASKSWPSEAEAKKQHDKLIAEKEKKGYVLVGGSAAPKAASKASAKATPAPAPLATPRNPSLEKAIFDNPEAVEGYEAYGAWLKTQGDPLAELIAIQTGLSKNREDKALKKKEREFLAKHEDALLGGLAKCKAEGDLQLYWRNGFIESVILGSDEGNPDQAPPEACYEMLVGCTAARFLHSLSFWAFDDEEGQPSYQKLLTQLEKLGTPPTLRHLTFDVREYQVSWTKLGNLHKLYPQLQKLESLSLHVGELNLGEIDLPSLRRLEIKTGGFTKKNLKSVVEASLPSLTSMILYFGTDEYGCDCKAKDVKAFIDSIKAPKLTRLGLCNSEFEDEFPAMLAASKLLPKLKHLELSMGTLSDEGAQVLLDEKRAFAHLESINLEQNYLSEMMRERLRVAFERIILTEQGDHDDDEDRYVQIAE